MKENAARSGGRITGANHYKVNVGQRKKPRRHYVSDKSEQIYKTRVRAVGLAKEGKKGSGTEREKKREEGKPREGKRAKEGGPNWRRKPTPCVDPVRLKQNLPE